jgi:hypothetical protein
MNDLHILELSSYTSPVTTESKRENWVEYGADNNYFQFLIDRYNYSTTNNAIINNISKLVYGRGVGALNANKKPNEYAQMMSLFSCEDIRKVVMDRKLLGQFAFQVHYNDKHDTIIKAYHIPLQLLRAEKCNEYGEIEAYYYSDNWLDTKKFKPKRIPAYGFSKEKIEILYCKPYTVGLKYYANVDYIGGLPYALLEQEIADYLINEVQNGFSGTKVVNFNNGKPSDEEQVITANKVLNKLTGSRGQKVIIAFNDNAEAKTTIDDVPLNDAPEHYQYLSDESMRKIMLAHNVTSPLLFGIATSTGFSSNADELKNSSILFDNMVIKPFQDEILEAMDKILSFNGISLKLYFKTLQPLEFTDLENAQTEEQVTEETGVELSSHIEKYGHDLPDNWVLIDEFEATTLEDEFDFDNVSLSTKVWNFVKTGTAIPRAKSEQDKTIDGIKFYTRYRYTGKLKPTSRPFCKSMIAANKLYRKEDIMAMSEVYLGDGYTNKEGKTIGWGPKGALVFDRLKYKGGGDCGHFFKREVYASFEGQSVDVTSPNARKIGTKAAEKRGYKVKNPWQVNIMPKNMANRGFLPTNKRFQ